MKRKKQALTLIEIMIVITLITLVTAVIGYNMKGSLEKGRAFRTKQAQSQLQDMLQLALAEGAILSEILKSPEATLKKLNLAKNPGNLLKDGWGEPFELKFSRDREFVATSERLKKYEEKHLLRTEESASDVEDE